MMLEKEISYTINLSQDLVYSIFNTYIKEKYKFKGEHKDFYDENENRTRYEHGTFTTIKKNLLSLEKFVHVQGSKLVPFVNRINEERPTTTDAPLKRIVVVRTYHHVDNSNIEIKFESTYFSRNLIDTFDSSMATKQIHLFNILNGTHESSIRNSHLGSDEILASLRIEYEYTGNAPSKQSLDIMTNIIDDMEQIAKPHDICPYLPHTTLQNSIIYRKFTEERYVHEFENNDILKWAIKLDGIRCKGYFVRNEIKIFMDDQQMFSGMMQTTPFDHNHVVCFQCEMMDDKTFYMTDILHVFKYSYNNCSQYELLLDPYNVAPLDAIECLNTVFNDTRLVFDTDRVLHFQKFFDPPLPISSYSTLSTDGYVCLNKALEYIKYKYKKTIEVEYNGTHFVTSQGVVSQDKLVHNDNNIALMSNGIYEAELDDNTIRILKLRRDRLVPN